MEINLVCQDSHDVVCFYERDFYVLSNFSAFNLNWRHKLFPTSEHAYQYAKFDDDDNMARRDIRASILAARSAYAAFKLAEQHVQFKLDDWERDKVPTMLDILRHKVRQHAYVRQKLLATGDRRLVEDSWRDSFWGWGPDMCGRNVLGKCWMIVRAEVKAEPVHF